MNQRLLRSAVATLSRAEIEHLVNTSDLPVQMRIGQYDEWTSGKRGRWR